MIQSLATCEPSSASTNDTKITTIRVIRSVSELEDLQPQWDRFTNEPLSSFDWNFQWWEQFQSDGQLRIFVLEENERIRGVAPFYIDQLMGLRRIRFLGTDKTCTDYVNLICEPDVRDAFEQQLAAMIRNEKIDVVELEGISADALPDFLTSLEDSYWQYECHIESSWHVELPQDWESLVASRKKSLKRKIKKACKRLDSGEVKVRSTSRDITHESAFKILVELHQERFVSKGKPGVFSCERFKNFLFNITKILCDQGRAEILVAEKEDGTQFASQLYLCGHRGPQLYQSGYKLDSLNLEPGHLLFTYAIREAIENGYSILDFLRGNEAYKEFWGCTEHKLRQVRLVSNRTLPTSINRAYVAMRGLKRKWTSA